MNKSKSSISKEQSYREIGEFWDKHDLVDYWSKTKPVEFGLDVQSQVTYFALDRELSTKIKKISRKRGISPDTLVNLWVQERIRRQVAL